MNARIAAKRKTPALLRTLPRNARNLRRAGRTLLDRHARLEQLVQERTADLKQALADAQLADKAKDAFLANVSHELRTPLGAIIGLSALALARSESPAQRDYLEKIGKASNHLSRIINDLLDLSKIAAGRMEFEAIAFSLRAALRRVEEVMAHKAEAKGLEFRFRIDNGVPDVLVGDPMRLGQILLNLTGNAIKFTVKGKVEVRVALDARSDGHVRLAIEVEDTGVGMRPEEIAALFQPFSQINASVSRRFGGTGLGLAISQRLAQRMDGRIAVTSHHGQGSTFRLCMRLGIGNPRDIADDEVTAAPPVTARYDGRYVLVVEDDAMNVEIVGELLHSIGISARTASDGSEAVRILAQEGPDAFDLVLMDIQMPIMDGLAATRQIRAWPGFENLPIVAMTAHALEHERLITAAAGMNDHVIKPIDEKTFYRVLATWLTKGKQVQATDPMPAAMDMPWLAALGDIDTAGALRRFLGNGEHYRHWLVKFVEESPAVAVQIRAALSSGQLDLAARTAHSFKSGAATIGLDSVQECAAALETALNDGQPPEAELERMELAVAAARKSIVAALGL